VIPMNRIFHSECLFVGLSNMFCVFFLFHLLLYFLFSCFIHFCSLFIQSCFSLLTILILIVYCLLYFPTNYHSLMIIYVFIHLCLFILVCSCFHTISCSCYFIFACCRSPLLTHYQLLFII